MGDPDELWNHRHHLKTRAEKMFVDMRWALCFRRYTVRRRLRPEWKKSVAMDKPARRAAEIVGYWIPRNTREGRGGYAN